MRSVGMSRGRLSFILTLENLATAILVVIIGIPAAQALGGTDMKLAAVFPFPLGRTVSLSENYG